MYTTMLQAKLHRVRVTETLLDYEGSCGIDETLLRASGMRPFQHIDIYNVSNGQRFSTYAITATQGQITLNGAAARRAAVGDLLIICAYSIFMPEELQTYQPVIVCVDERNQPTRNR